MGMSSLILGSGWRNATQKFDLNGKPRRTHRISLLVSEDVLSIEIAQEQCRSGVW